MVAAIIFGDRELQFGGTNDRNDVIEWFKYPHGQYHSQVELLVTSAYLHVAVEDDGAVGSLFRV